jgi:formamidopyrimidine-DNA glycosylase
VPELPEVETVRRGLQPVLEGALLTRVEQRRADLRFPFPIRFVERLTGQRVVRVDRRAKYILVRLSGGETLLMHLGMTGRFTVQGPQTSGQGQVGAFTHGAGGDPAHDHVVLHTGDGTTVTYNDARRFGYMDLIPDTDLAEHPLLRAVGIEPLGADLTPAFLARAAQGRTADTKAFLMDQRIVCGLGNIYVCETLFRAGLSPFRAAGRLSTPTGRPREGAKRLVPVIRAVLEEAIAAGGSTLRDYAHTDGSHGDFQTRFAVYDREGEPCVRAGCSGVIRRRTQANRSTFFCPSCQRA